MRTLVRSNPEKFLVIYLFLILIFSTVPALAQEDETPIPEQKALQQRIDFGNARILGQSIKSGAVYLMHRKKSDIKNMLQVRQSFRSEIMEEYGLEKTALANGATVKINTKKTETK